MKVEVTVKRVNGSIETLIHPKLEHLNDHLLAEINKAMAKAGRGQIVSYRLIPEAVAEENHTCDRCGIKVDSNAYNQQERTRWNGKTVTVTAHYCDKCRQVLQAVGAGEVTEMEARR